MGVAIRFANPSSPALACSLIPVPCIPEANPSRPISSSSKPPPLHPHPAYTVCGAQMSKAAYPLKLPNSIKQAAQRLAKEDGVSLNQWISSAVSQKVGSIETAAEFFKRRAARAKGTGLMHYLVNAPDVPEEPPKT